MNKGRRAKRFTLALGLAALAASPLAGHADAANAPVNSLALGAGSLSIGSMVSTDSFPGAIVSTGTTSGPVDSATWSDATGSGAGWNGTVSTTDFVANGAWTPVGGAAALTSTSSGSYTGSSGQAYFTAAVTAAVPATSVTINYTDQEGAGTAATPTPKTCTVNTACALANGVTINFATAGAYTSGMNYTLKSGSFAASALVLHTASATGPTATGTTVGGTNRPGLQNDGTTVLGGGATSQGTAVKFVSAAALTGIGSFTIAPGFTVNWDANNTWATTYSATAQYTISTGP